MTTSLQTPSFAAPPAPTGWRWAPWWVLAYVAFWPASRVSEGILILGALTALVLLAAVRFRSGTRLLSQQAWALTTVLFFAYWLPQLFSTFDAIEVWPALKKTLGSLRFLPFLWLTAIAVATREGRRVVFVGIGIIMAVWALDLLAEAVLRTATSPLHMLLNVPYEAIRGKEMCDGQLARGLGRVNGAFGTCDPILGVVLASFSPFVLMLAHRRAGIAGFVAAAALVGIAILLAGSRASWLTYALVLLLAGWHVLGFKRLAVFALAGVLALAALSMVSAPVNERVQRTLQVTQGGQEGIDGAISGRGRIWQGAGCMIMENPINGVGVREFRNAWDGCDPAPHERPEWGEGPAYHAHQLVLEVLSETGALGLLLWLAGAAMAWRAWRFASAAARERARPAMWALLVTAFPLNTHLAFYSQFWGGVFLLLCALYAGSLLAREH